MSDLFEDIGAEVKRLTIQGSMELANALFNGSAFVPYGPGQYTPSQEKENSIQGQEAIEPQRENEGMEM